MKKYLIIAVLLAMILGLMSVTGAAAYGDNDNNRDRSGPFKTQDAVLVTVCEDLELEFGPPNNGIPMKAINAKGYNKFKLYAYMEAVNPADFASLNSEYMWISITEQATLDPDELPYLHRGPPETLG